MTEIIELIGIDEYGRHGVYPAEKQNKQKFVVDVELTLNRTSLADEISTTIDYAQLTSEIRNLIAGTQFELIETLAGSIAQLCLSNQKVALAKVKVNKPEAAKAMGIDNVAVVVSKAN